MDRADRRLARGDRAGEWVPRWSLLILGLALAVGVVGVTLLRQDWAKAAWWPWLFLLASMFVAASALRQLGPWLPGVPILARPEGSVARARWWGGLLCLAVALGATAWTVVRLWPDQGQWQGTPILWLVALTACYAGACLIGPVGEASPRAAQATSPWPERPWTRALEALAFVAILALAIALRTYRLDSLPAGIYVDETNAGLDALYLLEGRPDSPFSTGWYETPNGYLYYMAGLFRLFGATWLGLKVASLLPAILTVAATYAVGRVMFGPATALGAMFIMAVNRWHLSMSRWGWNQTAPPLFQALALFFLVRGLRDRRARDYAAAGLLTGLVIYTYLSSRLVIATLALFVVFWLLSDPEGPRAAWRRCWAGLALFLGSAAVAAAPLAVTYIRNPFKFSNRASEINVFQDIRVAGDYSPLVANLIDMLRFFHQIGDLQGKHNLPGEPMADPITGLLFAIGLAGAIMAWREQRRALLLLWLVLGLSGSFLSSNHESPQSYRAMTALPAVVLLAAEALDRLGRALYRALATLPGAARARLPAFAAVGVAAVALCGAAQWEASRYFGVQASSSAVRAGFNPTENGVAKDTIAALRDGKDVYLSPNFSTFSPLRFLVYGVVRPATGVNTLTQPPYRVVVPEVTLPLSDGGHDAVLLLGREYWALRDYFTAFYPNARLEQVPLPNGTPDYVRIEVSSAEIAALQGLTERITFADGRREERAVAEVRLRDGELPAGAQVEWVGGIRLERGGEYELRGEGDLQVFIQGEPWSGRRYLGRGLYELRVARPAAARGDAQLIWRPPGGEATPLPSGLLFRVAQPHGLLATYYRGIEWADPPVYSQVTPFMLLAWPDEPPILPDRPFSARYVGALRVAKQGTYRFQIEADDGARLTLDGRVLGEGMIVGKPNTIEVTVALSPGDHPIRIDYFQHGGGSSLRLLWSRDNAPYMPVPPGVLIPPSP